MNISVPHRLISSKLFPGARRQFLLRVAHGLPHLRKIQPIWTGLIAGLGFAPKTEAALRNIDLERLHAFLGSGDLHKYEEALSNLGEDLAAQKVPEDCAVAALNLLFEVCLCGSLAAVREDKEQALGLARLAVASQLCVMSGYDAHRADETRNLQENLHKAEERAASLAVSVSEANEKERRRLANDLHDEIGHDLVVLKLYLEMILSDLNGETSGDVRKRLEYARSLSTRAIDAVRRLAFDLGPGIFEESGFVPAIRNYTRRFSAITGVKASVHVGSGYTAMHPRDELALYRVLQGALSNVLKHSRARNVTIAVERDADSVRMSIEDDGRGFSVERKLRDSRASFGLQAMRERIELLGGHFQIVSPAHKGSKRHGTRIEIDLPSTHPEAT